MNYICKKLRMLQHLKERGFLPIRTEPDFNNPKYNVWIFEKTEALDEAVKEYLDNCYSAQNK